MLKRRSILLNMLILVLICPSWSHSASVLLRADGLTDTYRLINGALGGSAAETPDCSDPAFGRHIRQEFDHELNRSVFVFSLHALRDNDRCIKFDRQRNEIKTYAKSPDYLKGFKGDRAIYSWKFKLNGEFKPSRYFTHIHQLKAGDGDADAPIVTFTPRAGVQEQLQLIHIDSQGTKKVLAAVDLAGLKGLWVEARERITFGEKGAYSISLMRVRDGALLLRYDSADIDIWRNGTTFVRPKWGIYRSLKSAGSLRDEEVRFADFCLAKGGDKCP